MKPAPKPEIDEDALGGMFDDEDDEEEEEEVAAPVKASKQQQPQSTKSVPNVGVSTPNMGWIWC